MRLTEFRLCAACSLCRSLCNGSFRRRRQIERHIVGIVGIWARVAAVLALAAIAVAMATLLITRNLVTARTLAVGGGAQPVAIGLRIRQIARPKVWLRPG